MRLEQETPSSSIRKHRSRVSQNELCSVLTKASGPTGNVSEALTAESGCLQNPEITSFPDGFANENHALNGSIKDANLCKSVWYFISSGPGEHERTS